MVKNCISVVVWGVTRQEKIAGEKAYPEITYICVQIDWFHSFMSKPR